MGNPMETLRKLGTSVGGALKGAAESAGSVLDSVLDASGASAPKSASAASSPKPSTPAPKKTNIENAIDARKQAIKDTE